MFFHQFHVFIVDRSNISSLNVKWFWTLFNVPKFLFHFQINESIKKSWLSNRNFSSSENFSSVIFFIFYQITLTSVYAVHWLYENRIKPNKKEQWKYSHRWKQSDYSPTTSKSLVAMSVWNDGASADTSQLYFPETIGCTWASDTWLSFDPERCNKTEVKINEKEKFNKI